MGNVFFMKDNDDFVLDDANILKDYHDYKKKWETYVMEIKNGSTVNG